MESVDLEREEEQDRKTRRIVAIADLLAKDEDLDRRTVRGIFVQKKAARPSTLRRLRRAIRSLGLVEFVTRHAPHVLVDEPVTAQIQDAA